MLNWLESSVSVFVAYVKVFNTLHIFVKVLFKSKFASLQWCDNFYQ